MLGRIYVVVMLDVGEGGVLRVGSEMNGEWLLVSYWIFLMIGISDSCEYFAALLDLQLSTFHWIP